MTARQAWLRLSSMRFFGRIGHSEEERVVGAHVEVDVEVLVELSGGPVHALSRTVDYREVHRLCRGVVEEGDHPLLEGLADELLDALEKVPAKEVVVRVRKPNPPIDGAIAHAEVEVRRVR